MNHNRTLVTGNLFKVDNSWEKKSTGDTTRNNIYSIEKENGTNVILKENFNTFLLQTNIVYDNSYLEYFIYPDSDSLHKIREICTEEDIKLNDKTFYFDCRIETFRNPPYLQFKNAILLETQEELDNYDENDLFKSKIKCTVNNVYPSHNKNVYGYMLVKTINNEGFSNSLKLNYLDPKLNSLERNKVHEFDVHITNDKVIIT